MSWVKRATAAPDLDQLHSLIFNNIGQSWQTADPFTGNCGSFAIALSQFLGPENCHFVLCELPNHEIMHVAVKYQGRLFDGNGETNQETLMNFAEAEDGATCHELPADDDFIAIS